MRDHRILIGTDGPYDNVLKIRPPLTIEAVDCDLLPSVLAEVLRETSSFN
jgi:4-aminobutyrate aminotransferase-like enzyme